MATVRGDIDVEEDIVEEDLDVPRAARNGEQASYEATVAAQIAERLRIERPTPDVPLAELGFVVPPREGVIDLTQGSVLESGACANGGVGIARYESRAR